MKTLKELKNEYSDLKTINDFSDLKALACNFIRMVAWKKEKDLPKIEETCNAIIPNIVMGIKKYGFNEFLAMVKVNENGEIDLHKAFNYCYLFNFFGKDYKKEKAKIKETKKTLL